MDAWKGLICQGNRSFERARFDDAIEQYQMALHEADRCIDSLARECAHECLESDGRGGCRYLDAVAALAAYVVTRLNLADLCIALDRTEEAAAHLRDMQARLDGIVDDGRQPWTLRAAALRNSRRAQDAVLSFVEEHGIAGAACAYERPITHLPPSAALH
jgi:tetratricopeptide (TPR) repeat protein